MTVYRIQNSEIKYGKLPAKCAESIQSITLFVGIIGSYMR